MGLQVLIEGWIPVGSQKHKLWLLYKFCFILQLVNVLSDFLDDLNAIFLGHLEIQQTQSDRLLNALLNSDVNELLALVDSDLPVNAEGTLLDHPQFG